MLAVEGVKAGTLAIGVPGFHIAPLDCRQPGGADR